ncbi:MAG: N-acetylmuramic acid 6-phosphate etherase [Anaerolineae bacterium]|nr:N-acetylmuramic acid 6-phosphate etherase [Anaerolineae bacterium]
MSPQLPLTETRNHASRDIDHRSTSEILQLINDEDKQVPIAVEAAIPAITQAVDGIVARMRQGGRLIYVGAGTSGRLGVVDASEMPPTFSVPPTWVIGRIAGGEGAMFKAVEGAEDKPELGQDDIAALNVTALDSVIGIAASGRTPYVVGGLDETRARGGLTISLCCSPIPSSVHDAADIKIALLTGPEVVTGSTRMKAGTATKMALNMISTTVMIQLGKTYGNLMVDLMPTNVKLRDRARRIVEAATGVAADEAQRLLDLCGDVKTAIVMALLGCGPTLARERLAQNQGRVALALNKDKKEA